MNENNSNTIPYRYRGATSIPAEAVADSRPDSGSGSRLFEISIWMWRYGRTFPLDVTVADAVAAAGSEHDTCDSRYLLAGVGRPALVPQRPLLRP